MNGLEMGLRERTRRAIQREIAGAAQQLFVENGYEATTVDDIAAKVGMSSRSVFRYFPTKEDIVVGKFDFVAEEMLQILRDRPADEPVWESLRRVFDPLVPYLDNPDQREVAESIQQIVFSTPRLLASYLEKLHLMQDSAEVTIRERARNTPQPYTDDDPTPGAIVGAAFGCLLAAQKAWLVGGATQAFTDVIDLAMDAVRPR